jgi:hypothetical protein
MENLEENTDRLEDKTNNEILLEIKQLQLEHEALKTSMLNAHDSIETLKLKIKKDFAKMQKVEQQFAESNKIILMRLKGNV